ncbi:MAG: hypothetical protein KIT84_36150 [Labilithrix sp.]|nr:hypothetical protein [Labilithrix sp.]MCW5816487.1 hypothetical protein [Labilithrix sp.]
MSERDDQPATVPPPVGEDDAYSATTKVGAMPADIMEKLRAEGLLPEEATGDRETAPHRPSTSLDKRPNPPPSTPSTPPEEARETVPGPIPTLYSNAPPPKIDSVKPPPPSEEPSSAIETPVAFAFPPVEGAVPKVGAAKEEATEAAAREETTGAAMSRGDLPARDAGPEPPSKRTLYLVAAFVVVALIVALLRLAG